MSAWQIFVFLAPCVPSAVIALVGSGIAAARLVGWCRRRLTAAWSRPAVAGDQRAGDADDSPSRADAAPAKSR